MDRRNLFKRSNDREPSEDSKRQRGEDHASGSSASHEARRPHLLFTGTTLPSAQPQELYERHGSTSFHPPARNEQSMLQHQQEEVFDIRDYLNLSSDSDHESDQRDFLQAHGPASNTPAQSSIDRDTGLHDANAANDAQSRATVQPEGFPLSADARPQDQDYLEKLLLLQKQVIDHSKGETDYNRIINFLKPEECKNLLSGLGMTHRTQKEHIAVEIFNTAIVRSKQLYKNVYIKKGLDEIRKENRYKEIYGDEEEKWRSDQEPSERTWITQQLHQLVDEMLQIKDFEPSTFQKFLSEESNAICEQLNKFGKSLNNQEWEDIKTKFQEHNVLDEDKRRRYLRSRTKNSRLFQRNRENRADAKAQKEGFTNRYRKRRLDSELAREDDPDSQAHTISPQYYDQPLSYQEASGEGSSSAHGMRNELKASRQKEQGSLFEKK
jgi:hypothetical protein